MQDLTTLQTLIVFGCAGISLWLIAKALYTVYIRPPSKRTQTRRTQARRSQTRQLQDEWPPDGRSCDDF